MSQNVTGDNSEPAAVENSVPLSYDGVRLGSLMESGHVRKISDSAVRLDVQSALSQKVLVEIFKGSHNIGTITVERDFEVVPVGKVGLVLTSSVDSYFLKFLDKKDPEKFVQAIRDTLRKKGSSMFDKRTDPASCEQYFQFYGFLSQQQNMLQDYVRTSTYQKAMVENAADFTDKVVLDVGAGSGILSFFAIQAGARKVYAVEASTMAEHCQCLVDNNMLADQIVVVSGKIEEIELPEMVDVIVSEPMGYMLFNERMLETFIHAKKWLKPGGMMYPSQGDLHIAPFTDEALHLEIYSKANFWQHLTFFGVDLSSLRDSAMAEYFRQPIVDTFDYRTCVAQAYRHTVDFVTALENDLHDIDVPLSFEVQQTAMIHGLAFWFDVAFNGSQSVVWLSTSPTQPLTHWYQVRCLVAKPVFARQGDKLLGRLHLKSNSKQSYDVELEMYIEGREHLKSTNNLDLKNPCFKYGGQPVSVPPGCNRLSPTDAYYDQMDPTTDLTSMDHQQDALVTPLSNCYPGNGNDHQMPKLATPAASDVSVINNASNFVGIDLTYINPGSIPAAMVLPTRHQGVFDTKSLATKPGDRSSSSLTASSLGASSFPLSNSLMIGDYVVPSNLGMLRTPPTSGLL